MLIGHYRVDHHLRDGSLGQLYEGVDSRSLRRVVIRILGKSVDDRMLAQLQAQQRALSHVQLDGIVGILDCVRRPDGALCVISPRAKGPSLGVALAQLVGRPWPLAQQLGQEVSALLAAAQQRGVCHLALRPSQILTPSSDQALAGSGFSVLGLGLAAALGRTWVLAEGLPRPPFAAPEQHADPRGKLQPVDERVDVFALGVLLWQAFLGSMPFPLSGPYQGGAPTFAQHRERPAPAIVDLLTAMVEANPRDRPTMQAVASRFAALGSLTPAPPPSALAPALAAGPPSDPDPEPINDESLFLPAGSAGTAGQPPDPNAGLVFGNFQTVRKIGEGGMGIVYEARHRRIGRRAAIKIMHKELAQNEEYASRFLNEARAVNIIQHRGLVEISEYGKLKDGTLFIVMEYLQGQSLWERFLEKKKFNEAEVSHLAVQIARALAAAHQKGIVHRDLKPENIMLVPDPVTPEQDWVKILDFGIAKVDPKVREAVGKTPKRRTQAGSIMGTPDYMAPEQFGGAEEVDGRADVFSLGVILYELLAGEPPYTGTPLKLLKQSIRPLGEVCPHVSRRLVTLIDRMLAVDAANRPTMDQVAQELSGMRSSSAMPRLQLPRFRLPRPRWLLLAAAVAVVLGSAAVWWLVRSGPPTLAEAKAHAMAVLEAGLRSDRPDLQLRAIGALAKSGDLNQRTLLEPLLQSHSPQAVEEAVHALGQIGAVSARPALIELLRHPHPTSLEITIADALANLKDPEGLQRLTAALDKEDPEFKLRAATLLLEHGSLAGAPALWERIGRANLSERASLFTIGQLAQAGDGRARQLLEDALSRTTDGKARLIAAFSLAKLGDSHGRTLLTETAAQPGGGQLLANQLLAAIGETSGSDLLAELARSTKEPDDNRELAISGLADCGREDSIALLDGLLDKGSTSQLIRIAAAGAILRLIAGERTQLAQQSLSWAKAALASDSAITRELATASLGALSSDDTIPPLGQALRDRQREVRRTAARALGTKSVRAALDALAGSLDDQDIEVRAAGMRAISRVVRSLRQQGSKDADRVALGRLKLLARDGSEPDRVVASGILLQLGDTEQQGRLRAALASRDALVRKLAVEMSDAPPGLFERALKDPDHAVRFAAARRLADQGSHLGVAILQEAVRGGDLDGLTAYGKLKRLGESVAPPEGLAQLLQSADLQARLDVLDAVTELPGEQALALLYLASHDFAAVVRRRAAEVAGEFYKRTGNSAFLNMIKILLHDADALVRAGAAELLLSLPKPNRAAAASAPEPVRPQAVKPDKPPLGGAGGQLRIIGDGSVRVQIDRGSPQVVSSKPVAVSAGKHRVSYVGGLQELDVAAGETVTVNVPTTYAEQLLHDGVEALQAKRLDRAQDYLERIRLLEQRGSVKRTLLPDVAFNLGRVYEDKRELAKALQEYGRLRAMAGLQSRPELRAGLDKAMARLAPLIGHIVLSRRDRTGHCIQVDVYLPPGTHSIDLGLGKPELVRAQAGVMTRVDKCQR